MNKTYFANCYLEFLFGGRPEGIVAVVSEQGALQVHFPTVPFSKISGLAGKTVDVILCGKIKVQGKLCKEINLSGAYYRLQFESLSTDARAVIRDAIALQRYPAPWDRRAERFASNSLDAVPAAAAEQPRDAIVARTDMLYDLRVVDFSREGILLEGKGSPFAEWHAGEHVEFQLVTNFENKLKNLSGIIIRISEDYDKDLNEVIYKFGIQLNGIDEFTARRYGALVENAEVEAKAHSVNMQAA